jgi:hypothetical protein
MSSASVSDLVQNHMERHYKNYHILAEAERDPDNKLFRALIFIGSTRGGVSFTKKERQPKEGRFSGPDEAEQHAVAWAMNWIDQKSPKD